VSRALGGVRSDSVHVDDEDRGVQMIVAAGLAATMDFSCDDVGHSVWVGDLCVLGVDEHDRFLGMVGEDSVNWRRLEAR